MSNILPPQMARKMYSDMFRIRQFDTKVVELVDDDLIPGGCHEYCGQEAVAVGVCSALSDKDILTSTHRGHGHILAKGGDIGKMFAELFGKSTGYNRGRGGSMHIADVGLGIFGANGIVGAGAPIACGAAHKFKAAGEPHVAVSFFGDGAINQGVVHEAMNLAAIWRLPVIFVCENNLYAMTTPLRDVTILELHERAQSYGMASAKVDGMDVRAVFEASLSAVERARSGGGPSFIQCDTYRYFGHYSGERHMKTTYRTQEEIDKWKERDPLDLWAERLTGASICSAEDIEGMKREVNVQIAEGVEYARQSPTPTPQDALEYMYAVNYPYTPALGAEQ